eukprot:gene10344-11252_t
MSFTAFATHNETNVSASWLEELSEFFSDQTVWLVDDTSVLRTSKSTSGGTIQNVNGVLVVVNPQTGQLFLKVIHSSEWVGQRRLIQVAKFKASEEVTNLIRCLPFEEWPHHLVSIRSTLIEALKFQCTGFPSIAVSTTKLGIMFQTLIRVEKLENLVSQALTSQLVLFNIYDDWLNTCSSSAAFYRLTLILRALTDNFDQAKTILYSSETVTACHHLWPTLTAEEWTTVETNLKMLVLENYCKQNFMSLRTLSENQVGMILYGVDTFFALETTTEKTEKVLPFSFIKPVNPIPKSMSSENYTHGIKRLPSVIMRVIQSFLNNYDYRQFLAISSDYFQAISYETIYYPLHKVSHHTTNFNDFFDYIFSKVQDRSKQIGLKIYELNYRTIYQKFAPFVAGLHRVSIGESGHQNADPFDSLTFANTFCNIHHLTLVNINELTSLYGLLGVSVLTISACRRLKTIGKTYPTIKTLWILSLESLTEIEEFQSINEVTVDNCPLLKIRTSPNRHQGKIVRIFPVQLIQDWNYFENIDVFSYTYFRGKHISLYPFRKVSNLTLEVSHDSEADFISQYTSGISIFTISNGLNPSVPLSRENPRFVTGELLAKRLHLEGYDMITDGLIYPYLEELSLEDSLIQDIQTFQNTKKVSFNNCSFFSSLSCLSFSSFYKVQTIILQNIKIPIDVSSLASVKKLYLDTCPAITDVSALGNIHTLDIKRCKGIKSLHGLGKKNQHVTIYDLDIEDFTPLNSIYRVAINSCSKLQTGKDLIHVQHLTFIYCKELRDISMLGQVQSLQISNCSITSLVGLRDVPIIRIYNCNELKSLEGLGNNRWISIRMEDVENLKEEAKIFLNNVAYVRIEESNNY